MDRETSTQFRVTFDVTSAVAYIIITLVINNLMQDTSIIWGTRH